MPLIADACARCSCCCCRYSCCVLTVWQHHITILSNINGDNTTSATNITRGILWNFTFSECRPVRPDGPSLNKYSFLHNNIEFELGVGPCINHDHSCRMQMKLFILWPLHEQLEAYIRRADDCASFCPWHRVCIGYASNCSGRLGVFNIIRTHNSVRKKGTSFT